MKTGRTRPPTRCWRCARPGSPTSPTRSGGCAKSRTKTAAGATPPARRATPTGPGRCCRRSTPSSKAAQRGVGYLRQTQQPGGGWRLGGNGALNTQSTAWAVEGLLAAGANPAQFRRGGQVGLRIPRSQPGRRRPLPLLVEERPDAGLGDRRGAGRRRRRSTCRWRRCRGRRSRRARLPTPTPAADARTAADAGPRSGRGDAVAERRARRPPRAARRVGEPTRREGRQGQERQEGQGGRAKGRDRAPGPGTPRGRAGRSRGRRSRKGREPGEGEGGESSVDSAAPVESESGSGSGGSVLGSIIAGLDRRRPALRARLRPLSPLAGDAVEEALRAPPPPPADPGRGAPGAVATLVDGPRQGKPSGRTARGRGGDAEPAARRSRRSPAAHFEVVVIGGGITGAGVALDAASRGYSVALLERDDYAVGTSSRSSKMVHGGLRYLQNFDLGLVREALLERQLLVQLAPHLVYPTPFLVAALGEEQRDRKVGIGLNMYDVMATTRVGRSRREMRSVPRRGRGRLLVPGPPPDDRPRRGAGAGPGARRARSARRLPLLRLPDRRRAAGAHRARRGGALRRGRR